MRKARILAHPSADAGYYHLIARAIERRFIFDDLAKEKFRRLLEAYCAMSGVELLTWCCLSNHFHLLVKVPNAQAYRARFEGDDQALLRCFHYVTNKQRMAEITKELLRWKELSHPMYLQCRQRLLNRLADVSVFMRELKQRFTQWHNRRVERKGPLWEDRFTSVLVEDDSDVLMTMAAYIDLNAVRAGLVDDPKDYRWCGYAEALAGNRKRQRGIKQLYFDENYSWKACREAYRGVLLSAGGDSTVSVASEKQTSRAKPRGTGIPPERRPTRMPRKGRLPAAGLLRLRVRYFCDGLALGSKAFVEAVFARNTAKLQVKRTEGARIPKGVDLGQWRTLLDLRKKRNDNNISRP